MAKIKRLSVLFRRIPGYFRRLQWKLTLAYTLSTVVTAIVLGAIGLGLLWFLNFRSNLLPNAIAASLIKAVRSPAPYLAQTPPDRAGLQAWLDEVTPGDYMVVNVSRENTENPEDTAPAQLGRVVLVAIVDHQGRVLAATPDEEIPIDGLLQSHVSPEAAGQLQAALAGETEPERLASRSADGDLVAAAPILNENEQPLGAIFVKLAFPLEEGEFLRGVLRGAIFPVAVGMLVSGLVAGILFGFLIARGLARRLRVLANAADIWSRGDFSIAVRDSSGDELGQLAQHLNRMAEQLQALLQTRQELAALEERNRLARDLHDSVKQQVFATAMQVGTAKALMERSPDAAQTHLAEAEHLVRQAQQELTTLIQELRPAALEGRGLATALKDYVVDWSRQADVDVDLKVQGERPIPLPIEQAFFRVAQEALTNAARHSHATEVEVHLAWEAADTIALTIFDNGQGFDVDAVTGKGLGLRSMRERMEAIGGRLTIDSQPDTGTWVKARCPNCLEQGGS